MKKYKAGMYGGKFMPFHRGHLHCLQRAIELCDTVYLVLVCGGNDEERILSEDRRSFLLPESRWNQILRVSKEYNGVIPVMIDVSTCRTDDGIEDWDMETPIMLSACGRFDAVFGSECSYEPYFKRAYPWADYVLVDPKRADVSISATAIREMESEEMAKWII